MSILSLDSKAASKLIEAQWDASVLSTLKEYISIPNQSPGFDPEWETNGFMDQAVDLYTNWIKAQNVPGLTLEVLREKGRTPVLFMIVPGSNSTSETVLMYGHMDKQPPMAADWMAGTGPHTPVIKDGKLYGRGGADDGYAMFAAINALQVLQAQGLPHARAVILIENCEESGSRDLPYFLDLKKKEVGEPSLVLCLDSGCHNYVSSSHESDEVQVFCIG
jgi:acetylornithine deacetylase/succinyl-diaminopimelate desuccinylase-like protein